MLQIIKNESVHGPLLKDAIANICNEKLLLSQLKSYQKLKTKNFSVKLIQADRNIICDLILTKPHLNLIVKFATPANKFKGITFYEKQQWEFLVSVLHQFKFGKLPDVIAFDDDLDILVLGKIKGPTLHHEMRYSLFNQIFINRKANILSGCYKLGKLLAALHNQDFRHSRSPMKYSTEDKLNSITGQARNDDLFEIGISNFNTFYKPDSKISWTHGNLRSDNIIFSSGDVALIDLENAGIGDPMEDLGRLIAFIMMFRRFSFFPRHFWQSITESILNGYCSTTTLRYQQLLSLILGEILFVYGRDYVVNQPSLFQKLFKTSIEDNVKHLLHLLQGNPEMIKSNPCILIN